ncbi:CubicO group peptidase, beta-lactamase class C family [Sesbania bispinosa]|nr:CubicO group peptidase, beta-lactamase class C family [Sesbania bispinosa]
MGLGNENEQRNWARGMGNAMWQWKWAMRLGNENGEIVVNNGSNYSHSNNTTPSM